MHKKISAVGVGAMLSILLTDTAFSQPSPPPIPDWLKKVIPGQNQPPSAPPATSTAPTIAGSGASASSIKPPPNTAALFQQGGASGEELKYVLEEIVLAARQSKSRVGLAAFANGGSVPPSAAPSLDPRVLMKKIPDTGRYLARSATVSYSDKLLGKYIASMTESDETLRNERVTLPTNGATMKPEQQQRLLVMGAMVIASRISSATLEKARKNFDVIRNQYATLLQKRQMAAEFLASVFDKRRQALAAKNELQARNLQGDLTAEDIQFIDSFGPNITVETFSNDVGLQNMALKYLRKSDPVAYNNYTVAKEEWVSSSKAYLQTMSGVSAFGGFCVLFLKQVSEVLHQRDFAEIAAGAPLAAEFVKTAGPLMLLSGDTLYAGFVLTPNEARRTYRLEHAGLQTEFNNAPEVFKALIDANDKRYLDDAVFRNEAPGFVSRVYQCDITEAGNLLDDVVPAADRKRFGENFMNLHEDGGFSFADSLLDDGVASDSKHLAESLLNRDQRSNADSVQIGEVQRLAINNDATWGNTQLMRLVLANSDGSYAQMQLGGTIIRLVPSMATIYAYESYANVCLKTASQEGSASPKAASKKPAKKATWELIVMLSRTFGFAGVCLLVAAAAVCAATNPDAAPVIKIQRSAVRMPAGVDISRMQLVDEARMLRVYTQVRGIGDDKDAKLLFSADVMQKLGLTNQQINRQFQDTMLQSHRFQVFDDTTTVVREGARQTFEGKRMDIVIEGEVVGSTQEIITISPYRKVHTMVHLSVQMKDVVSGEELLPGGVSPVGEWGMVQGEGTLIAPNADISSPDTQASFGNDYQRALGKALRESAARINGVLRPLGRVTFADAQSVGIIGGLKHGFQGGDNIVVFHADMTELGSGSERHKVIAHVQPLAVARCDGVGTETSQCDLTVVDPTHSIAVGDFAVLSDTSANGVRAQ